MPDYDVQRFNMVETQVRANDVTDPRIHAAMGSVPRERFIPAAKRALAYADVPVEVAQGRYLIDPRTFAKLVQLAAIQPHDSVLDVACATGYSTVVLAKLAKSVTALEQDADLVRIASDMVPATGAKNATVVQGGLTQGCMERAPFDVILINGAVEEAPDALLNQLAEGGRLVAIVGTNAARRAHIYVRERGQVGRRADFDSAAPLLAGFRKVVGFVF